ncbi:MAG: hypothetical protein KDD70_12975, partial [Bdellovibrionales bacterium]|nr:hypothetical protein [Bdellovibrionales bacterium]
SADLLVGELLLSLEKEPTIPKDHHYNFTGTREEGFTLTARIPFSAEGEAKPLVPKNEESAKQADETEQTESKQ